MPGFPMAPAAGGPGLSVQNLWIWLCPAAGVIPLLPLTLALAAVNAPWSLSGSVSRVALPACHIFGPSLHQFPALLE